MTNTIESIYSRMVLSERKKICVLIDPDKHSKQSIKELVTTADSAKADFLMLGSSLLLNDINTYVDTIKKCSDIPLILFPGQVLQLSLKVDAILFLSLVSGRNPDLLIGKHIETAPLIKKSGIETIPTGYMLVESGNTTSVEYMSNSKPLPANKPDIAVATAQAAELLGMKLIYMDAGSGARNPVSREMIKAVKSNIDIPLIIGGGLRTKEDIESACNAGADVIVLGNILENDTNKLNEFASIVHSY